MRRVTARLEALFYGSVTGEPSLRGVTPPETVDTFGGQPSGETGSWRPVVDGCLVAFAQGAASWLRPSDHLDAAPGVDPRMSRLPGVARASANAASESFQGLLRCRRTV
ncbi:hypothetical protein AB7C87_21915 [Natrarchaeobius sp. A-rgal3]|uniref:hypothetical protein n=1 Tax=Natrarchaeobius versutus TaxID=1679078 RepID=UPI00350EB194